MAMEALLVRAGASRASSAVLSLPRPPCRFSPRALSTRCSSAPQKRASAITTKAIAPRSYTKTQKCRALPLHCFVASSLLSADPRLDFKLSVGNATIPHPAKVEKGGEDAFFVSNHNGGALGIADGVSGLAEENIDPALFSRELMEHAVTALDSALIGNCPRRLLAKAHEATSAIGAATAIVALLEKEGGILHIANVGDCGLRLVRKGSIVFATSTQEHYFDCPYQLSSEPGAQTAVDAMVYKVELLPGDIIIMGSDGLFDNVYDKDIEKTVRFFEVSDDNSPQQIASALAALASKHAKDVKYESPFSREAVLQGYDLPLWKRILGQKLTGGKLDDITVLTANVVATLIMPKVEPVISREEDTSLPPVEEKTTIDTVVSREEETSLPSVEEKTNIDIVISREEDTSLPPVEEKTEIDSVNSREKPVISRDEGISLPPVDEKTYIDTVVSREEPVMSSEEETAMLIVEEKTDIDTVISGEEPVISREDDPSLSPVEENANIDTTPNGLDAPAA